MKAKTVLILLAAAGVLAALSFLRYGGEKRSGDVQMGDQLFADLPVNAVVSVTIADAESEVTLVKGDAFWQVQERSGYPADFDELRDMVVKLSRLKIGRSFPASPESLARLSLLAPSAPEPSGRGKQITLKDQSGEVLADVILGQSRETGGGQYLKMAAGDTVFLVDGSFQFLKTEPAEWLEKEILDIKAVDVKSVTCFGENEGTPVYTLSRPGKGDPAVLAPVPPGRTANQAKIDQVLDALAPLSIDDVQAGNGKPPGAAPGTTRLVYQLYDGRQVIIVPEYDGKENRSLRVFAAASTPEPAASDVEAREEKPLEPEADAAPAPKTASQLNEELSPWVFQVKKWQFDSFITQPEALLDELKQGE
ncbi:DUF4340 domain-containing protein [Desulfosarcina sp.]|uniref:DUF4340 domain-containing protein n=1 Tax=Desulfosarcina sp. TaxID=2027861 RepID=UPI003970BE11